MTIVVGPTTTPRRCSRPTSLRGVLALAAQDCNTARSDRSLPGARRKILGPGLFDVLGVAVGCCSPVVVLDLTPVLTRLDALEELMATAAEQITALSTKVDDIAADFAALRDAMLVERENLTTAGQAALDAANAKLDALDTEVGDADGSDTPTP
jgi:hypothetical protein